MTFNSLYTYDGIKAFAESKLQSRASTTLHKAETEILDKLGDFNTLGTNEVSALCIGSDSQSIYQVSVKDDVVTCTCPAANKFPLCKHGLALLIWRQRRHILSAQTEEAPIPAYVSHGLPVNFLPSIPQANVQPPTNVQQQQQPAATNAAAPQKKAAPRSKKQRLVDVRMTGIDMLNLDDEALIAECRATIQQLEEQQPQQAARTGLPRGAAVSVPVAVQQQQTVDVPMANPNMYTYPAVQQQQQQQQPRQTIVAELAQNQQTDMYALQQQQQPIVPAPPPPPQQEQQQQPPPPTSVLPLPSFSFDNLFGPS